MTDFNVQPPLSGPGYWMNETSGRLVPIVRVYLLGEELSDGQIAIMRAYLAQWVFAPGFAGVDDLRQRVSGLRTTSQIRTWIADAVAAGIDPL